MGGGKASSFLPLIYPGLTGLSKLFIGVMSGLYSVWDIVSILLPGYKIPN